MVDGKHEKTVLSRGKPQHRLEKGHSGRAADASSATRISGTLQASSGLLWLVSTPPPGLGEAF